MPDVDLPEDERWLLGYEGRYAMTRDRVPISYIDPGRPGWGVRRRVKKWSAHPSGRHYSVLRSQNEDGSERKISAHPDLWWALSWERELLTPTTDEAWCLGYEGRYTAHRDGRLFSYVGGWRQEMATTVINSGYALIQLRDSAGTQKAWLAHILVLTAFEGPKPADKDQCSHWDGNKLNNHIDNLRWATLAEDVKDKRRHGSISQGEKVHWAKLSAKDVMRARALRENWGAGPAELARYLPASSGAISTATLYANWKHVPPPTAEDVEEALAWWQALDHAEWVLREGGTATEKALAHQVRKLEQQLKRQEKPDG